MFRSCAVAANRREAGERVPRARRPRLELARTAGERRAVVAVGLRPRERRSTPSSRDGDGAGTSGRSTRTASGRPPCARTTCGPSGRILEVAPAAPRIVPARALRRPCRDLEEVRGKAPAVVRLEHVVLEDEVARVRPVVREVARVVVAHDVDRLAELAARAERASLARSPGCASSASRRGRARASRRSPRGRSRPSSRRRCRACAFCGPVRTALVPRVRVVERADAAVRNRIGNADRDPAVPHRESVRPGVRPEVGVERAVLLHDHHDVLDRVDPGRRVARDRGGRLDARAAADRQEDERRDGDEPHADANASRTPGGAAHRAAV